MSRGVLFSIAATALGLALIVWGWVIQGKDYVPGLLLEVGATLALAVPLIALNRMTERRVRRTEEHLATVRDRVQETWDRLDNLDEVTREGLLDRHQRRGLLLEEAARTPTADRLALLVRELTSIGAVDPGGVRVRLPNTARWLRFTTAGSADELKVVDEQRDGTAVNTVTWPSTGTVGTIATALKCKEPQFEAACQTLVGTLSTALSARLGETGLSLGQVIEVPNEQWVISGDGLHCTQRYAHLRIDQLFDSHQDWRKHMLTKSWVNPEMFKDAYRTASELLATRD